ncbi:MAG: NADPH:quinone oxidoreductase family protein [Aestuariivita sp.]|nr:NADPH:quinone oxidoreductase family protein [Aestuariivita sp.]
MLACRIKSIGKTPVIEQISIPSPGKNEVRLTVHACGLNFADLLMQRGLYQDTPKVPFTLGMEVAGEINAVGSLVTDLSVGDRVAVVGGHGGLAEQAVYNAQNVIKIPKQMTYEHAAAFQIAYGTSHVALSHRGNLKSGENLVVLGAAGGVGLTAVEIGKLIGANVIAIARGKDKLTIAERAGANHLIDTDYENIRDAIKKLGGADIVYDPVGGTAFEAVFRACKPEARLLIIGFASGDIPKIPANHLLVKNISVLGFYWGGYLKFRPNVISKSMKQLITWYLDGQLNPHISHRFSLQKAVEGLKKLRDRKSTGKVLILP